MGSGGTRTASPAPQGGESDRGRCGKGVTPFSTSALKYQAYLGHRSLGSHARNGGPRMRHFLESLTCRSHVIARSCY